MPSTDKEENVGGQECVRNTRRLFLVQDKRDGTNNPSTTTAAEQAPQAATNSQFMVTAVPSRLPRQAATRARVLATSPQRSSEAIPSSMPVGYEHCTIRIVMATPTPLLITRSRLPWDRSSRRRVWSTNCSNPSTSCSTVVSTYISTAPISFTSAAWCGRALRLQICASRR